MKRHLNVTTEASLGAKVVWIIAGALRELGLFFSMQPTSTASRETRRIDHSQDRFLARNQELNSTGVVCLSFLNVGCGATRTIDHISCLQDGHQSPTFLIPYNLGAFTSDIYTRMPFSSAWCVWLESMLNLDRIISLLIDFP